VYTQPEDTRGVGVGERVRGVPEVRIEADDPKPALGRNGVRGVVRACVRGLGGANPALVLPQARDVAVVSGELQGD
jgi:hypothetical protein